ncbi:MAG: hypothetical protein KGR26_16405 [Cyanobacteria bacterium REEB65]|nr:hypothetical protein [Cyanobacteria bacterium REEB65]
MSEVKTYRAMDYQLKLYGFWPMDIALVGLVFIACHTVLASFLLDLLILVPGLGAAWFWRNRPPRRLASLLAFAMSPKRYGVGLVREVYLPGRRRP